MVLPARVSPLLYGPKSPIAPTPIPFFPGWKPENNALTRQKLKKTLWVSHFMKYWAMLKKEFLYKSARQQAYEPGGRN